MKSDTLSLKHERVDDIPLLLGFMQELNFPELLEQHLGSHHLHRGMSNGWLATVWLAFVLSQANHRKVSVQDWACSHAHTWQSFIGQALRPIEFSDDRLSIILRRLQQADWPALETDLWKATCEVYEIPYDCIRLDSTTSFGYHTIAPDGLMQRGHSKDHRPDLPQLKLMAAAAQPTSHVLACDIVPGQAADDPLYLPLIRRVRQQLRQRGLLYSGDCKMAALATRTELEAEKDFYLMPLPRTGEAADQIEIWIDEGVQGQHTLQKLTRKDDKGKTVVFALAYERRREQSSEFAGKKVDWSERVQVIRSLDLARRQAEQLDERLQKAMAELWTLTPPVGRGHKQIREEETLRAAVSAVAERHRVQGLLEVNWQREEEQKTRFRGSGRRGPGRPQYTTTKVRYVLTTVQGNEAVIEHTKACQGWRVQVTNLPVSRCSLREAVLLYNGGWSVERDFHLLKDQPLGIQPLFVREDEQIVGLTRLLMIALRVLTLSELQIRGGLAETEETLSGLYEGQARRKTESPTAARCLKAIGRMEITATRLETTEGVQWHMTPLPQLLKRMLKLLNLSPTLYTRLTQAA